MSPRSSSGWVPARGWFFVLAGLLVVETVGLATVLWRRPTPPKSASPPSPTAPVSLPTLASVSLQSPIPSLEAEDETPLTHSEERDPLARALQTRSHLRRTHRLEDLGASLARTDLRAALRTLSKLSSADGLAFVHGIFDTLGQGDRHFALATASEIADETERLAALRTLLVSWQGEDNATESRFARGIRSGSAAALGMRLLNHEPVDAALVQRWAQLFTQGSDRAALLGGLAGTLARTEPSQALAYGAGFDLGERRVFNRSLIGLLPEDWLKNQPQAVLAWSQSLPDTTLREQIGDNVFENWSQSDPAAAAQAALALPPGRARESALDTVAGSLAQKDTAAADALAQSLSGRDREVVDAAVEAQTPVGIGASLQMNDGVPVVSTLVDNMPAVLSGQIHPGDRIVGITRPDGVLIKTTDLDLSQVVNLIRGAPASTVQLQVAQAQSGGGFAPPTTITLVRQRVTHG